MQRLGGPRRTPAARRTTLLALGAALALWLIGIPPAQAHNALRSTAPAADQTVATAPTVVVLTFDQPAIAMGTQIQVVGPDGQPVQDGPPVLVDATVRQPLRRGVPPGAYRVEWRVTSVDGHPISGTFAFTVTGSGGSPSVESAEPGPTTPAAPARPGTPAWAPLGAGVVIIAAILVAGLTLRRRQRAAGEPDPDEPDPDGGGADGGGADAGADGSAAGPARG